MASGGFLGEAFSHGPRDFEDARVRAAAGPSDASTTPLVSGVYFFPRETAEREWTLIKKSCRSIDGVRPT